MLSSSVLSPQDSSPCGSVHVLNVVELGDESGLRAEGPDGGEAADGRGQVRKERRPRDPLEALHRPRRGDVEPPYEVEEDEHGGAGEQDQRLREADDRHQSENRDEGLNV